MREPGPSTGRASPRTTRSPTPAIVEDVDAEGTSVEITERLRTAEASLTGLALRARLSRQSPWHSRRTVAELEQAIEDAKTRFDALRERIEAQTGSPEVGGPSRVSPLPP